MKWNLKQIPKILHVYWGTGNLPYLRFMTVKSFMDYNPDWKVILWYPKYPANVITWKSSELNYQSCWVNYLPELIKLPIEKNEVDFNDYGLSNNISEVHKSDILRYWFLYNYGGVYSDMDILYFRPITKLQVNSKENEDIETFVCISRYGHSNGFFMAVKGSKFFKAMFKLTNEFDMSKYQSVGPDLCNKNYPDLESISKISPVEDIGMDAVYYYNGQCIQSIYKETDILFPGHSIGIHWYAGHPLSGKFLKDTKGGTINYPDNILGKLCKIIL